MGNGGKLAQRKWIRVKDESKCFNYDAEKMRKIDLNGEKLG